MHTAAVAHSLARALPRAALHGRPLEGILAQLPHRQSHALKRGKATLSAEGMSMLRATTSSIAQVPVTS